MIITLLLRWSYSSLLSKISLLRHFSLFPCWFWFSDDTRDLILLSADKVAAEGVDMRLLIELFEFLAGISLVKLLKTAKFKPGAI